MLVIVTASLINHLVFQALYLFKLSGHEIIKKKNIIIIGFLFSLVKYYSGSMKVKEN